MGFELFPFDIGEGLLQIAGDFAMPENLIFSAIVEKYTVWIIFGDGDVDDVELDNDDGVKDKKDDTDDHYDGVIQD